MKMKMMALVIGMMSMIMMLAAPVAHADTIAAGDVIRLEDKLGFGNGSGGAFELYKGSAYQFDTFCLEWNEYFNYGELLTVASVTKEARNGGIGGAVLTNGVWSDPLSQQTAYLYYNFRINQLGSLSNGAFNYSGTSGNASANALQTAIWYLEGETTAPLSGTLAYNLVNLANTASASALQTAYNNVGVLNLIRANGENGQDQLTLTTTVPEPATMLLFGLGLIGLAGVRRVVKN